MFLARTVEHTTDWRGMLNRMDRDDFREWQTLYKIEPWGIELPSDQQQDGGSLNVFKGMAGY